MLNKVCSFIRGHHLLTPGDTVICAVSGGADSVALLWAMYLLQDKLSVTVKAAHFNHGLRGEESLRDQEFVQKLCDRYDIPLYVGCGQVIAGNKGLEAAARDARYDFFASLTGKIATAHTADDNAETILMHLVRGTGLKGLGGISPIRGSVIRPMLNVTRQEVLSFLDSYSLSYVVDSSNETDTFFRNRIRHRVMPLLLQENPSFSENVSAMALRLRQDEEILQQYAAEPLPDIKQLREMPVSIRYRYLCSFLEQCGVKEPTSEHIRLAENLVFSDNPSAKADFPGGVTLGRQYDRLIRIAACVSVQKTKLDTDSCVFIPDHKLMIRCEKSTEKKLNLNCFTVYPQGQVVVRSRMPGDEIKLSGGTKSLKALFIDKKIPAHKRQGIPVIADDIGVLGVWGIGANLTRTVGDGDGIDICFTEEIEER
jgi:tRNA(Ile)-lysidine synthase